MYSDFLTLNLDVTNLRQATAKLSKSNNIHKVHLQKAYRSYCKEPKQNEAQKKKIKIGDKAKEKSG